MGVPSPWHGAVPDRKLAESAAGMKPKLSLTLFLEVHNLEIEHELARAATCLWAPAVRTRKWEDEMREAWERTSVGSCIVDESHRAANAVFCEMRDLGVAVPSWQVLRMSDGRLISVKGTCPEDIKKTLLRDTKNVYCRKWAKKDDIEEPMEGVCGSNQSNPCGTEKVNLDGETCSTNKILGHQRSSDTKKVIRHELCG